MPTATRLKPTTSAAQTIQVLAPFGLEKVQVGQTVPIQWQTSGLTASSPVALIDAGGGAVGNWLSDSLPDQRPVLL